MYKCILFDLDDTLFDFSATEKNCLPKVFERFGHSLDDDKRQAYESENRKLWSAFEAGEIPLESVLDGRFYQTMKRFGTEIDGHEWDMYYRSLLSEGTELVDGAIALCKELHKSHRLFLITNGVENTQLSRLRKVGVEYLFEGVFISQRIGARKPSAEFFDYVKQSIADFNADEALVVGDSIATDICGGNRAGIDTCLFDRFRKFNKLLCDRENQPKYVIHNLHELKQILQ